MSIAIDPLANIYLGGYFAGSADFDLGTGSNILISAGSEDIFLVKIDSTGNSTWAKRSGGSNREFIYSLFLNASGNIFATGLFSGTSNFNTGSGVTNLIAAGAGDAFIAKYDQSGNLIWANAIGGTGQDGGNSIVTDVSGNILLGGFFSTSCDFDPGAGVSNLTSSGGYDAFVAKFGNCFFGITSHPTNQTALIGSSVQFSTATSNSASLCQWQQNTGNGFIDLSNGGQYSGANTATLTINNLLLAQNNFSFRCVVTQSGCVNVSNAALLNVFSGTGINEPTIDGVFTVYPNPVNNYLTIAVINSTFSSFRLCDQTGKLLLDGKLTGSETSIDVTFLSAGLYFISIDNVAKPVKVVKQ